MLPPGGMVARHRECLEKMTAAADGVIAVTPAG
jgi:hypothetical protein